MSIGIIIELTLREAARRKVLWGLLILTALFWGVYALGLNFVHDQIMRSGGLPRGASRLFTLNDVWNFWLTAALYAANFLIVMMAVLTSVDTVAGEIASGTIQSIAVKPLRRFEIVLGKWLGFALMLGCYIALLVGGVIGVTRLITGYAPPNVALTLGLMFLEALVLLSVSILGGTRLSTLTTGVLGFGLFGLAFVGSWMEQIGGLPGIESDAAVAIGKITSFVMPSEALWRYALSQASTGLNPFSLMFSALGTPDSGVVLYALLFAAAALLLAIGSFRRRDL
ncbi:MAG TPA: ABC transporter permease [Anaerolineae bacterium]|nr:ABC transporter permease [Anaerolineae bacterium]